MHLRGNRRFVLLPFIKYLLQLPSILLAQKMQYSKCFSFIRKPCLTGICLPTNKKMFNVSQSLNEFYWFAKKGTDSSSLIQLQHMLFSGEGLFAGSKLLIKRISRDNSDNYLSKNHQLGSYLRNITAAVKLLVTNKRRASSLTLVTSSSGKVLKRKKGLKAFLQWKVHLAYPASLQALHSNTQKQII